MPLACPDPVGDPKTSRRGVGSLVAREQGRADLPQTSALFELRCAACGYGVAVRIAPERCPMCGGVAWERPTELLSAERHAVGRQG
jgi:hypothetical protein